MNEKEKQGKEQSLEEIMNKLLKAYQLEGRMKEMDVISSWEELMGTAIANRTSRISIKNKVLYLEISSSVMRDELVYGKQVIIDRINQFAGEEMISDVYFS